MKQLLFILLLIGFCAVGSAQKNFEGKILYKVSTFDRSESAESIMTIFFSPAGIRLEVASFKSPQKNQEALIINFDSGTIMQMNPTSKTYTAKPLEENKVSSLAQEKNLAGYRTTPVIFEPSSFLRDAAHVFGTAILHRADSLFYAVPKHYAAVPELMMVDNGRIVLGGDFYPPRRSWPKQNPKGYPLPPQNDTAVLFRVTAHEVLSQHNPDSLFVPGATYVQFNTSETMAVDSIDSISTMIDTTAPSQKPPAKTKHKSPAKKKATSSKQSALRRKDD